MKKFRGSGRLWLVTSVLSVGVMSLFLSLDQASAERGDDRSPATHVNKTDDLTNLTSTTATEIASKPQASIGNGKLALDPVEAPNAVVANLLYKAEAHKLIKAGSISAANLKIFPAIKTNYLDDEATRMRQRGELVGRMMPRGLRAGVAAGGGCSFNVDCDDCDPCTNDRCVINVAAGDGPGDGKCTNTLFEDGQQGGCSDGDPCNGIETCQVGECELPGSGTAILGRPYCAVGGGIDPSGICIGGVNNGNECDFLNAATTCPSPGTCEVAACDTDAPSVSVEDDFCVLPCTVAVCKRICSNEGISVNAGEICVKDSDCPGGSCLADNPCPGGDGDCDVAQGQTCLVNDAVCTQRDGERICSGVETCDVGTGTCSSDGVNPCGPSARCSERSCPGNTVCFSDDDCNIGTCDLRANGPGCSTGRCCTTSDGGITFDCFANKADLCTGVWFAGDVGFVDQASCSGPLGCPKYGRGIAPSRDQLVNIGFVSDSPCTNLFDLGDDYTFANGSYMKVDRIRFIGQVFGRASVEFFDANGSFIEDTISGGDFTGQFGVQSLEFDPPIVIPPTGFVVIRNASNFTPNGGLAWASAAVDANDPGGNDANKMWANGAPVTGWLEICAGGDNDGDWCNPIEAGADCPLGTCTASDNILSFELVGEKTTAPIGACCNPTTIDCEEVLPWLCDAANNIFNEVGSQCAACGAGGLLGNACRICTGGATPGVPCFADADCGGGTCDENDSVCKTCNAGALIGDPCSVDGDCTGGGAGSCTGTCELLPTCVTGACCSPSTGECTENNPGTCAGDGIFSGYGTSCSPNCCTQPNITGGDDCGIAIVQNIIVPGQADPPVVVTISGNNSGATASDDCSLGIFKTTENLPENVDLGWWEGFSINECSFVTVDMCCSDPIHEPQWSFIIEGCPCTPSTIRSSSINPNKPDLEENARGAPFCDEDNLWMQFGPLPAGTYYIPILTDLAGAIGDYQLHITSEACPDAACCHLTCDGGVNSGNQCEVNADCDSNSCIPQCALLNVLECQAVNGTFLAPPLKTVGTVVCSAGLCDTGSCCVGPGDCVDDVFAVPLTKTDCDGEGGKFAGGVRCFGGTCVADPDLSCAVAGDCADNGGPGGSCTGSTEVLRQPSPCPICELLSTNRCQFDDGVGAGATISDNCVAGCVASATIADDFKALEQGDITQVCTYGIYLDQGPGGLPPCATPPEPSFIVRIYEDAGGIPGLKIGDTTTTAVGGVDFIDSGGDPWYRFTLTLDTPIGTILINETYWLEIQANTDPVAFGGDTGCDWFWGYADVGQGNNYSVGVFGGRAEGLPAFTFANFRDIEQSWCINLANEAPTPPTRACCTCDPDNPCVETTYENCDILSGDFIVDQLSCAGFSCPTTQIPVNDNCGDAIVVSDGTEPFSNFCASPFGSLAMDEVVCTGGNTTDFKADIWYEYTATCTGEASFELCDSGFFDSVLAVYGDESPTCTCPLSATTQIGECSDDDCIWGGGRSQLQVPVIQGNCYLIRLGGLGDEQDTGELDISCGLVPTAPDAVNPHSYSTGALACGGGVNYGLPCQTCTGGSRDTLTCLTTGDCPGGGTCAPDNSLCPGATCGGAIAGGTVTFPWPGSRFVGFSSNTTWAGKEIAVRAKMVDIDGFPACNGKSLWAGAPAQFCEGGACTTMFWASQLQDTPFFMDWTTVGDIQLYGQQVAPGSRYAIQALAIGDSGNLGDETKYSDPAMLVDTANWGDVVTPLAGFTSASQPAISDVLKLVDKWLGNLEPRKSRTLLQPADLNVSSSVGIADVLKGVDAWLGTTYPFTVTCP